MPERSPAFANVDEAVAALSKFSKTFVFPRLSLGVEAIAREAAKDASLKSLIRKRDDGLELYGRWTSDCVPRIAKSARYVVNQGQFDILVRRTGLDLLRSWRGGLREQRAKFSFGAAFRAVDLLFKAINESENCRSDQVQRFLHVPLDGSTLRPLRHCIDELVDRDFSIEIPTTASTGYVSTEEQYLLLQEALSILADRAGVPPILYAYYCASVSPS